MEDFPDLQTILVVIAAFAIGYGVVNFIIYVLRRGREQQNPGDTTEKSSSRSGECRKTMEDEGPYNKVKDEAYYGSVLGLPAIYTIDDIRSGYRKLVAQYHPDKVSHLGPKLKIAAESEMKEINVAYSFFKEKYKL